jgi:hypothetical protein
MTEDRWYTYALPILQYVHENGGAMSLISISDIAEGTGLDPREIATEAEQLYRAGYLAGDVHRMGTGGDPNPWILESSLLGERGLRVVGAWPGGDPYATLLRLVEKQIEATDDPERKSKLKQFASSVTDVGKQTVAGILAEVLKGNIHL